MHLTEVNRLSLDWERFGRADKPYALEVAVEPTNADPVPHPIYRFVVLAAPSPNLPLVIGDCVHNLRCALDYIAWVFKA